MSKSAADNWNPPLEIASPECSVSTVLVVHLTSSALPTKLVKYGNEIIKIKINTLDILPVQIYQMFVTHRSIENVIVMLLRVFNVYYRSSKLLGYFNQVFH